MKIRIVPKHKVAWWVAELHQTRPSMALGTLLAGDRWSCVSDCAVAELEGRIVGIATIAPKGEQISGQPTVVALYVQHAYRGQGIGSRLLEAAIDHLFSQGLEPVRLDITNSAVLRLLDRLPEDKRARLDIKDMSLGGLTDFIMQA